jgi:hypothetical protein
MLRLPHQDPAAPTPIAAAAFHHTGCASTDGHQGLDPPVETVTATAGTAPVTAHQDHYRDEPSPNPH